MPEFKEREQRGAAEQAQRRARLSEKAMARKPKDESRPVDTVIRAAGHH
jgi:hypothetical protein